MLKDNDQINLHELQTKKTIYETAISSLGEKKEFNKRSIILKKGVEDILGLLYPQSVIQRIEEDFGDDKKGLQEAKEQLSKIYIKNINKETANSIEIDGKDLSILHPEANGKDIFAGNTGYEHVRYIGLDAANRELKKAGMNDLDDPDTVESFIIKHIPGSTLVKKILNFVDLMGLKKSGNYYENGDRYKEGKIGYVYVAQDKYCGYNIFFSDTDAGIFPASPGNYLPVLGITEKSPVE